MQKRCHLTAISKILSRKHDHKQMNDMVRSVDSFCFNQKFVGAFTLRGLMGSHVRTLDDFSPEDASIVKLKAVLD